MLSQLLFAVLFTATAATTEWWGDLRAHLNPPKSPAFYDVTYDESECSQGLRSDAIPEFVYFGTMIASISVHTHDECLQHCVDKERCKAVNYFQPLTYMEKGFCELLSETQLDNPRLMRPFRHAVYYENIRCREADHIDDPFQEEIPLRQSKEQIAGLMKKLSSKGIEFNARNFRAARK